MFIDKLSLKTIISSTIISGIALITYLVLEILVLVKSISLNNVILIIFNSILLGIGIIFLILDTLTLSLNRTKAFKVLSIITECFSNVFYGLTFISVILAFAKPLIIWICFSFIVLVTCSNIILIVIWNKSRLIYKFSKFFSAIQAILCYICLGFLQLNLVSYIMFLIAVVLFIISRGFKLKQSLIILESCSTLLFIICWSIACLFI